MADELECLVSDFHIGGLRLVDVNEDDDCPVCWDALSETRTLQTVDCSHILCRACTLKWYLKDGHNTCPLCRKVLYYPAETVTIGNNGGPVEGMNEVIGNVVATFFYWNEQRALDDTWFRAFARQRLLNQPWVEYDLVPNGIELLIDCDINNFHWPVSTFGLIEIPESLPDIATLETLSNSADVFIENNLRQKGLRLAPRPAVIPPYDSMVAVLLVIGNLIPVFNNWRYTAEVAETSTTLRMWAEGAERDAAWAKMIRRLAAWCKRHQGKIFCFEDDLPAKITYDVYDEMLDEAWSGVTLLEGERAYLVPGSVECVDFQKAIMFVVRLAKELAATLMEGLDEEERAELGEQVEELARRLRLCL